MSRLKREKVKIASTTTTEIEAPEQRQAHYILQVCLLTFLLVGLLTLVCLIFTIFFSWESWIASTVASCLLTAAAAFAWWLAVWMKKLRLAAWINVLTITAVIILRYWQAPYFIYYLAFIFILTLGWLTLGQKATILIFGFLFSNTLLYSILNDNAFYSPDDQKVKLDYGSFGLYWLIVVSIIWMFSFLFNTVQRDNALLNQQAVALNEALEQLKLKQAEQLKAEEALRLSQAQLLQAQKMESIGRLAGGVAHDFNNLLTAITGYGDMLFQNLEDSDPLKEDVGEILAAADKASSLTRQLLAFSRRQVLQPKLLDLNLVIDEMNKLLKRLIGEDIELSIHLAPRIDPLMADRGQIEQVIMNLVVNARDAMPAGGQLTIETANVYLDEEFCASSTNLKLKLESGNYVLLAVSDTGLGMDETTQSHIFEPFFTTKSPGEGTGLGLATTYGIVKQSGGHIFVYSTPGLGTTFKIYLPQANSNTKVKDEKEITVMHSTLYGSETILIVEDEEMIRQLIYRILTKYGYRVLCARQGREALAILDRVSSSIDLVLTDLIMPEMGGLELIERLSHTQPELKVIGMSGYTDRIASQQDVFSWLAAYIQKPFTPVGLLTQIRDVLDPLTGKGGLSRIS
jgi:signal transduction histidine kinase